jgi:hypothetical protein
MSTTRMQEHLESEQGLEFPAAGGERREPVGRPERTTGRGMPGAGGPVPGGRAGRELSRELVAQALERARSGLPVGDLPEEVREQLTDAMIDELLAGKHGEAEILGSGGLLGDLTRRLVERALESELSGHLGYEHGQAPLGGAGNARNGAPGKTLLTDHGPVQIAGPRDRNGTFEPQIVVGVAQTPEGLTGSVLRVGSKARRSRRSSAARSAWPRRSQRLPRPS